ncbi:hypothetical protein SESBI_43447 [Sesbania bispinosa]|nr:hypothetical protein SESBI_43447 [Sesbania bispinosa]
MQYTCKQLHVPSPSYSCLLTDKCMWRFARSGVRGCRDAARARWSSRRPCSSSQETNMHIARSGDSSMDGDLHIGTTVAGGAKRTCKDDCGGWEEVDANRGRERGGSRLLQLCAVMMVVGVGGQQRGGSYLWRMVVVVWL